MRPSKLPNYLNIFIVSFSTFTIHVEILTTFSQFAKSQNIDACRFQQSTPLPLKIEPLGTFTLKAL